MTLYLHFIPGPLLIGLLILTAVLIRLRHGRRLLLLVTALFGLYVVAVIGVVFFPLPFAPDWPANLTWPSAERAIRRINLVPFNYNILALDSPGMRVAAIRDVVMNFILTLPFGLGIGLLASSRGGKTLLLAASAGLILEGAQLLLNLALGMIVHSVDITDVMLNGAGGMVGYWLAHAIERILVSRRAASPSA